MPITNYGQYMSPAGGPGKLANFQDYAADTYGAAEVVPFGTAVQLAAGGGVTPLKAGGTPIGVAMSRGIHDYTTNADDQKYEVGQPVPVMKRGNIFVVAGGDVTNGAAVKVDVATGKFVATGDAAISFPSSVFRAAGTANGLVQIEINLP